MIHINENRLIRVILADEVVREHSHHYATHCNTVWELLSGRDTTCSPNQTLDN